MVISVPRLIGALCLLPALFGLSGADPARLLAQMSEPMATAPDSARLDAPSAPSEPVALEVWNAAQRVAGQRILVSLAERRLWLMDGAAVLFSAPVAVGKPVILEYEDQVWNFTTPRGRRQVIGKRTNPVWTPPDWHYVELAVMQGWKLEQVRPGRTITLGDGSRVTVRNRRIGRLLPDGSFVAVPIGEEAVFEGTLFVPPLDSKNRRIPGELGRHLLDLGGAYYIHGTPYPQSIGSASTHGCVRMLDDDIEYLFRRVRVGTPVFLY
jgi:hypothetical protein